MKQFSPATSAYLARRGGSVVRVLVHAWARNRQTDEIEPVFIIDGTARTYYRAEGNFEVDEIASEPGTDVRFVTLRLCGLTPEIITLLRAWQPRFAAVEIHRALFDADSGALVDTPTRLFRGWIDGAPMPVPALGEDAQIEIRLASANRGLTRTLAAKKSDAALQAARQGDKFRQWVDVSGKVAVVWGERRV